MEPRAHEDFRQNPAHLLLLLVAAISVALLVLVFPSPSRQEPWNAVNVTVVAAGVLLGLLSSGRKSSVGDDDDNDGNRGKKKKSVGLHADNRRVNVTEDCYEASTSRSSLPEIRVPSLQHRTVNVVGERVEAANKARSKLQSSLPIPAACDEQQRSYQEKEAVDHHSQQYYKEDSMAVQSGIKVGFVQSALPTNTTEDQQRLHREKKVANRRDGQYYKDESIRFEAAIKARSDRSTPPISATEERQRLHPEKKVANLPDRQWYKDDSIRPKSANKARPEQFADDDERQQSHRDKKVAERWDVGQFYKDDSINAFTGFDTDAYYYSSIRPTRRRHRRSASLDWPDPPSAPMQRPIFRSGSTSTIFGSDSLFASTLFTQEAPRLQALPSLRRSEDADDEEEEGLSNSLADLSNNSSPVIAEIPLKANVNHQSVPIKVASPLASPSSPDTDSSVNQKAGDFINWFREQIRLQKLESLEREKKKKMLEKGV